MPDPSQWHRMTRYAFLGTEFIIIFGMLLLGGVMLDGRLNTSPLFTLIGTFAGFGLGLYRMISDLRRQERKDRQDRNQ